MHACVTRYVGLSSWEVTGETEGTRLPFISGKITLPFSVLPCRFVFLLLNFDPLCKKRARVPELACREGLSCPAYEGVLSGAGRGAASSHTAPLFRLRSVGAPGSRGRMHFSRDLCVGGAG